MRKEKLNFLTLGRFDINLCRNIYEKLFMKLDMKIDKKLYNKLYNKFKKNLNMTYEA
jgi:ribosomal protein L19E